MLTKDRAVHQLQIVFFKIIFSSCTLMNVEVDVVFQPWWLIKWQKTMNVGKTLVKRSNHNFKLR